jgi:hypothetical protein
MLIGFSWTPAAVVRPTLTLRAVESDTLEFDAGAAGTLYWLASGVPEQSGAQVKAGGAVSGALTVSEGPASGVLDLGPLGGGTRYFHAVLEAGGVLSAVVTEQVVLPATLSGAAFAEVAASSATLAVSTDVGDGALFAAVYPSDATPGAAEIKAGLEAAFAASLAPSGPGEKTFLAQGLAPGTAYRAFFVQNNGPDSAVLASAAFTTAASATVPAAAKVNEVLFDEAAALDLSLNGVPFGASGFTLAMRLRIKSATGDAYFVGQGFDSYIRFNATGTLRVRVENVSGGALIDQGIGSSGTYAMEQAFSILLGIDRTQAQVVVNGDARPALSYADAGSQVKLPRYVNKNTAAASDDRITVSGLWIGLGRIDPAANYQRFFDADGTPTADMLAGNPIAGLAPVFAESGPASKWNVRPGMTGAAKDV